MKRVGVDELVVTVADRIVEVAMNVVVVPVVVDV